MLKLRLVFMGSSEFAVPTLKTLLHHNYDIAAVVTAPDKPQGRGQKVGASPVKLVANEYGLPVLQPTNLKSLTFLEILRSYQANLQIVVAFRMLPQVVWAMPNLGSLNLHASLLPQYRGAAPINWAIIHGEQETGVTTFFIEQTMDTGHILLQKKIPIHEQDTAGDLTERLKYHGAQLMLKSVEVIKQGGYSRTTQASLSSNLLKQAPKLYRKDCQINWRQDATTILNFIRGLSPAPGAWTTLQGRSIKILKAQKIVQVGLGPKLISSDDKHYVYVGTQHGAIAIEQLQLSGKRPMSIQAFLQGHKVYGSVD